MAITASISLARSVAQSHAKVDCVLTINNTGGAPVNLTAINPYVTPATASEPVNSLFPPKSGQTQIPAGGSISIPFTQVFWCNIQPVTNPVPFNFQIGCTVYTDDGSVTTAPPASVNIIPTQASISSVPGTIQPTFANSGQYPNLPASGHTSVPNSYGWGFRFEDNLMSGLVILGV